MDCCELARLALWVIGGAFGVILILFVMFFGYSLSLGLRTVKLEKKNGKEQHQIEELRKEIERQSKEVNNLRQQLKSRGDKN